MGKIRTFGDLMRLRPAHTSYLRHCKVCHYYGRDRRWWAYSARASICENCATERKGQLLPAVATAERTARRWVKQHADAGASFIAHLSGASLEYVERLVEERRVNGAG